MKVKLSNRYFKSGDIGLAARVSLRSRATGAELATAQANNQGVADLSLKDLADGEYRLVIDKPEKMFWAEDKAVGPGLKPEAGVDRMWRPFRCSVSTIKGKITKTDSTQATLSADTLEIKLLPVWIRSADSKPRSDDPILVLVHRTARPITSALLGQAAGKDAPDHRPYITHYGISPEGYVIKFATENRICQHASGTWSGKSANAQSVGIELVSDGTYPNVQVEALEELLTALCDAYPIHAVIGHNDVEFKSRDFDPGPNFDWPRIERLLRDRVRYMIPGSPLNITAASFRSEHPYGDFFETFPNGRLMLHDSDATHRYGGKATKLQSSIIYELTADLKDIGYACTDGTTYGLSTQLAVKAFQHHFFSGSRIRAYHPGQVDSATADMIKAVSTRWTLRTPTTLSAATLLRRAA